VGDSDLLVCPTSGIEEYSHWHRMILLDKGGLDDLFPVLYSCKS
jgi:hypothetical protein